jgi:hypothetical protein
MSDRDRPVNVRGAPIAVGVGVAAAILVYSERSMEKAHEFLA